MKIFIITENFLYHEATFIINKIKRKSILMTDYTYTNKYISGCYSLDNIYRNIDPSLKWYINRYILPKNLVSILKQFL